MPLANSLHACVTFSLTFGKVTLLHFVILLPCQFCNTSWTPFAFTCSLSCKVFLHLWGDKSSNIGPCFTGDPRREAGLVMRGCKDELLPKIPDEISGRNMLVWESLYLEYEQKFSEASDHSWLDGVFTNAVIKNVDSSLCLVFGFFLWSLLTDASLLNWNALSGQKKLPTLVPPIFARL